MKPSVFDYYAPDTLDEALALLAEHGDEAKPLAGGQSLVPTMSFRLAQYGILVDLNGINTLFGIREGDKANQDNQDKNGLYIGAMTRQRAVERSALVARHSPLIAETMPYIAHPQVRNRGTFGGSLAHADPASELPALAIALGMKMRAQSIRGERWIAANDFFLGLFETDLEEDELLTELFVPPLPARTGTAFDEVARRHGDFAMAGAAAVVTLAEDGTIADSKLVFISIDDAPIEAPSATALLQGQKPTPDLIRAAANAIDNDIDPVSDLHASASYRRHLAKVLARRTLARAIERVG